MCVAGYIHYPKKSAIYKETQQLHYLSEAMPYYRSWIPRSDRLGDVPPELMGPLSTACRKTDWFDLPSYIRSYAKKALQLLCCIRTPRNISNEGENVFVGGSLLFAAEQFGDTTKAEELIRASGRLTERELERIWIACDCFRRYVHFPGDAKRVIELAALYCQYTEQTPEFTNMVLELAAAAHDSQCVIMAYLEEGPAAVVACCSLVFVGRIMRRYVNWERLARFAKIDVLKIHEGCMDFLDKRKQILNPEWENPWAHLPDNLNVDVDNCESEMKAWFGVE